jgi:hypothetical protein
MDKWSTDEGIRAQYPILNDYLAKVSDEQTKLLESASEATDSTISEDLGEQTSLKEKDSFLQK